MSIKFAGSVNIVDLVNCYVYFVICFQANSRVGMMRCSDGTLHYFLDGVDQGVACTDLPTGKTYSVLLYILLYIQYSIITAQSSSRTCSNAWEAHMHRFPISLFPWTKRSTQGG